MQDTIQVLFFQTTHNLLGENKMHATKYNLSEMP